MSYKPSTLCVQGTYQPKNGEARQVPIVQSTTYKYESAQAMGDLFDLKADGFFYTRLANPTAAEVETKLAALEGGVGCMLTASGMSATMLAVTNIVQAGGHVICANAVYGGTFNLFNRTLRELGIEVSFAETGCTEEALNALFNENTRAVFAETLSNPSLNVLDIEMFARAAHAHGVPLIVDNTFATPINCRPFEFGADIVVHSTSKYLDGHAAALGGAIVDNGKFPMLTTPDETYHGITYTEHFGKAAYIAKARVHLMRDMGPAPAPMNAFLLNLGMETLHLRMKQHCSNAMAVAQYLESDERISWVHYPDLESDPEHALAAKYLPNGSCGVVSFGIAGGREAAVRFMDNLKLAAIVTHVADARTCVLHPASTTHRQMTDEQLLDAGVSPDLIRFSVGIEDVEDILADIRQALDKV